MVVFELGTIRPIREDAADVAAGLSSHGNAAAGSAFIRDLQGEGRAPEHGLWLLPTPEFAQHGVAGRRAGGLTGDAARRRRDRDVLLTEMNRRQVRQHGMPSADVDGNRSLADTI